jgi:protein required for attachment to host cells
MNASVKNEERIMSGVTWILVADRSRAKLLHRLPDGQVPYPTLHCWSHGPGRVRVSDRKSDQPGRVAHPAGYYSALEPHEDLDHVEARRFAAELTSYLEGCRLENRFDDLIVVAAPKFLGTLRESWSPVLGRMVVRELNADVTGLSDANLQSYLESREEILTA